MVQRIRSGIAKTVEWWIPFRSFQIPKVPDSARFRCKESFGDFISISAKLRELASKAIPRYLQIWYGAIWLRDAAFRASWKWRVNVWREIHGNSYSGFRSAACWLRRIADHIKSESSGEVTKEKDRELCPAMHGIGEVHQAGRSHFQEKDITFSDEND
jgi:hypothetical protein